PLNARIERLIAANIDIAVNVVSVKAPPLRPRLIDRFLIAIQRGGAQPAVCVNKIDLADDRDAALQPLRVYEELGVPLVACSTKTGEGLDRLRTLIEGRTCAFVGHSGVGKSSLLNALDARLRLATGDLQKKRGTGRHTTTASTLFDLGNETYVIDTPGIREFGLWDITRESLRDAFPEFEEAAEWCRFNDCTHLHEPDCEVKRRVERGEINPARYETYVRLAAEM
ncbi:MAG TPA: ribosome small subunit-dependent GTPase A, partial [Thermoanaerobaculia bacterium]|nr:ribosome small subunit-dependent GTPase A [Thermoanaerobaculia bacterium]